ncbi:MAG: hypothetical protein KBA75_05975 [Alphaproteobacteria bacterium]|nr:hypothetical protein [Alphaproteobacteria bacterium]
MTEAPEQSNVAKPQQHKAVPPALVTPGQNVPKDQTNNRMHILNTATHKNP